MTTPDPGMLLSASDFARFKSRDESWFLGVVGDQIRDYCGWHIAPVLSITGYRTTIGNDGIIMLPTTRLLSVEQFVYDDPYVLSDTMFEVHEGGWIQYTAPLGRRGRGKSVTVDFTCGYEALPTPVAEVGFELAADLLEKPNGVVTDMTRGPTKLTFKELGSVLSQDQKDRLGPYCLVRI